MKHLEIKTFKEFLDLLDDFSSLNRNITLFRGQSNNYDLLPSIARKNKNYNTTDLEIKMLAEFKRRTITEGLSNILVSDWDWLIYGQHFGLKTRLLDWSSNPLISLWFALMNNKNDSYLYVLSDKKTKVITSVGTNPFELNQVELLKPSFNNKRIVSQSGWFTAHNFDNDKKEFIPLNKCPIQSKKIVEIKIPKRYSSGFIKKLDIMGINSEFIFQDVIGTCNYINWQFNF